MANPCSNYLAPMRKRYPGETLDEYRKAYLEYLDECLIDLGTNKDDPLSDLASMILRAEERIGTFYRKIFRK